MAAIRRTWFRYGLILMTGLWVATISVIWRQSYHAYFTARYQATDPASLPFQVRGWWAGVLEGRLFISRFRSPIVGTGYADDGWGFKRKSVPQHRPDDRDTLSFIGFAFARENFTTPQSTLVVPFWFLIAFPIVIVAAVLGGLWWRSRRTSTNSDTTGLESGTAVADVDALCTLAAIPASTTSPMVVPAEPGRNWVIHSDPTSAGAISHNLRYWSRFQLRAVVATAGILCVVGGLTILKLRHLPPASAPPRERRDLAAVVGSTANNEDQKVIAVEIVTTMSVSASILGSPILNPDSAAVRDAQRMVRRELGRYPDEFLRATRCKRVVICANLEREDTPLLGTADRQSQTLYLKMTDNTRGQRITLHHEIFHFIDESIDALFSDQEWRLLNAPGFIYAEIDLLYPGANPDPEFFRSGLPGFVNHIAQQSPSEDKAETFSCMMCDPEIIAERILTDEVLAAKVRRIREMVRTVCPTMDDQFWR